uniref:Beta-carotene isomerase D27-like C-terminal domain-containing protein n=1 Tax=Aegilops tauschii subsp. strangulata TaxID=200361 RepID=A0A452XVM0_AEGTS
KSSYASLYLFSYKFQVRVLQALFPPLLLVLFKALLAPIANGQLASMMVEARATALSCQWLMGTCSVNSVTLPNGKSLSSGVFVEKCKYLEESKCLGICINTCKLPTQVCLCVVFPDLYFSAVFFLQ